MKYHYMPLKPYLGKNICFICVRYYYFGTVVRATKKKVYLSPAILIEYITEHNEPKRYERLPGTVSIYKAAIEAYFEPKWDLEKMAQKWRDLSKTTE